MSNDQLIAAMEWLGGAKLSLNAVNGLELLQQAATKDDTQLPALRAAVT